MSPEAQGHLLGRGVLLLFLVVVVHVARTVHGSWRVAGWYALAAVVLWTAAGVLVALVLPLTALTAVAVRQHLHVARRAT